MAYMYILECSDGTFYTGSTIDLDKRVEEHNSGLGANYTSERCPVKLVYFEVFDRVTDAFEREKQVQNWTHEKKKLVIENRIVELKKAAKKKRIWGIARESTPR